MNDLNRRFDSDRAVEASEKLPYAEPVQMTLEGAIQHCEEVVEKCPWPGCVAEYRQLAEWLRELQEYRKERNENAG